MSVTSVRHRDTENTEAIAYLTLTDPWYSTLPPPVFHLSRETVRPYYHGWVLSKGSVWRQAVDTHILQLQMVSSPQFSCSTAGGCRLGWT